MIDLLGFYAKSAILQPYNGGKTWLSPSFSVSKWPDSSPFSSGCAISIKHVKFTLTFSGMDELD